LEAAISSGRSSQVLLMGKGDNTAVPPATPRMLDELEAYDGTGADHSQARPMVLNLVDIIFWTVLVAAVSEIPIMAGSSSENSTSRFAMVVGLQDLMDNSYGPGFKASPTLQNKSPCH